MKDILDLIEIKLDIKGTLELKDGVIVPSSKLTKKTVKEKHIDDLFQWHDKQFVFTNRFMRIVGELFDRRVKAGHYKLTLE